MAHIEAVSLPCATLLARLHGQYRLRCQINCSAVLDKADAAGKVDAVSSDAKVHLAPDPDAAGV